MQKWLSSFFVLWLLLTNCKFSEAQQSFSDIELIKKQNFANATFDKKRKVKFMLSKSKNPVLRYNPVSLAFGGLLFIYQKTLSEQISANCPYEISCSNFAKQCIQRYGFLKGIPLAADRLTRCTQFGAYDLRLAVDLNDNNKLIDPIERYKHIHE